MFLTAAGQAAPGVAVGEGWMDSSDGLGDAPAVGGEADAVTCISLGDGCGLAEATGGEAQAASHKQVIATNPAIRRPTWVRGRFTALEK